MSVGRKSQIRKSEGEERKKIKNLKIHWEIKIEETDKIKTNKN